MTSDRRRLDSVDLLRGIIMILMALDHTRDFFGDAAASPTNLPAAGPALFLTRWITHFCAPTFFLLAGVGARLALRRRTPGELSRFLVTRGLWLVLLELTVARFFWQFNVDYRVTMLTVFWAIGWSMVALALLVRLPVWVAAVVGVAMISLHNLTDRIAPAAFGSWAPLWITLHRPGPLIATPDMFVFAAYPLVPWIGVMAAGYALGGIYTLAPERRRRLFMQLGAALTVAFLVLRSWNVYGDPAPRQHLGGLMSVLSFLNTTKYPPSLLFLLMTLGPALIFLGVADARTPAVLRPALVYGRVPFFYYLLHVLVLHILAVIKSAALFGAVHWMFESPTIAQFPVTQPPGWPSSLPVVYLVWIGTVMICYPLCRWYSGVRARRSEWWFSYL